MTETLPTGAPGVPAPDTGVLPRTLAWLTAGAAATGPAITTIAPFTGDPLVRLPQSTAEDVAGAFAAARAAQVAWAARPVSERVKPLLALVDQLLSRRDELLDLIQLETGKARLHAFEEVLDGITSTLYFARHAPGLLRRRRRSGALPVFTEAVEVRQPRGVVATITPWNYPMALTMDVVPALLAGNAVVHKPDNQTALSSLWPRALLIEAGLPADLWQVVLGEPAEIGDALIEQADYIGFTGSTRAGRAIGEKATARLIGCSLELGGKNPMLVLADADVDRAAENALRGCFANAGQLCVSIERIYVHSSVYADFVDRFAAKVKKLTLGSGLNYSYQVGTLTSKRQLDRVSTAVAEAISAGAPVRAGGRARPDLGPFFFEPTVLTDLPDGAPLLTDETFGPVVSVQPFDTDDQAVVAANATQYGLNASVFSRNIHRAKGIAERIKAGTVNINESYAAAYASQGAPMGGMKQSGLGRRHGPEGLLKYTEAQTVAVQRGLGFDPAFGMSPARHVAMFTASIKAMKTFRIR